MYFQKKAISMMACAAVMVMASAADAATEFTIGDPVIKNGMQIVPHYLTGVQMESMKDMPMGPDVVHLEVDIHADKNEAHGFAKDAWIPYLTVTYRLKKVESNTEKTGTLLPMTAGDGPHYANNLALQGPGEYHLTYHIEPPSKKSFLRHVDKATGVPEWWHGFDVDWTFTYPKANPAQ
jgi:uncharacterized protein involved in high-affinity Fe2+ transport